LDRGSIDINFIAPIHHQSHSDLWFFASFFGEIIDRR
jgi:hypothetical protein